MMDIMKRATPGRYVLVVISLDDSKEESDEHEEAQPESSAQPALMETEAPSATSEIPPVFAHASPRAYDHLKRLESVVGVL